MNKKLLPVLRWCTQILFLLLLIFSIRLGMPLYNKLLIFTLIFLIGNYYCGWVCPFGTVEDLLALIGRRFIRHRIVIPQKFERWLRWLRYITLFVSLGAAAVYLDTRRQFFTLTAGHTLAAAALACFAVIIVLSLFTDRPFCRYICPEGARYGAMSAARIFTVSRDSSMCIGCRSCDRICPMNIAVSACEQLYTPQCISCGRCLSVCPRPGTLKLRLRNFRDPATWLSMAVGIYFLVSAVSFALKRVG